MKVAKFVVKVDQTKCTLAKLGLEKCAPRNAPNCQATCPMHIDVRGYVGLIRDGKFDEALTRLREYTPFLEVLERVCPRPCESMCKRGEIDEPVAINALKRSADDYGKVPEKDSAKSLRMREQVAIAGAGPAGLAAAFYLAKEGYPVTVFERLPVAGGMLAVGIPEYRLPRDILVAEIERIQGTGVEIKTGLSLGEDISLESLRAEGYQALFIATGLHQSLSLNVEGENLPGIVKGIDFLKDVALKKRVSVGKKVIVIGGGNVAIDAALTAKRLGAQEVSVVCLEEREEMPAWEDEIQDALEEGIMIINGLGPRRFLPEDGKLSGIEFKKCTAVFDERGRFNPQYDETDLMKMEAQTAILAIGQTSDPSFAMKEGLRVSEGGRLEADPFTLQTEIEWVFAGGDALYGPKTVVEAVACGKTAAESIRRYIQGQDLNTGRGWEGPYESGLEVDRGDVIQEERCPMHTLDVGERDGNFCEINLGIDREEAIQEAERCLSCECHMCESICPTGAIEIIDKRTVVDEKKCVACFRCVDACEENAIRIVPRPEPVVFGLDPSEVDQADLKELCIKANLHPKQFVCLCSGTRVEEAAAAVLKGAKTPEEISLMTGARSGCGLYCMAPMLRLLKAHGVESVPPEGHRWYNVTSSLWDTSAKLDEKYPGYFFEEDKTAYRKIQ